MHVLKLLANQHPVAPDGVRMHWGVAGCGLVTVAKLQLLSGLPHDNRDQQWNWG